MSELESLLDKLHIFEKMYNAMRIVDPVRKTVLELKNGDLSYGEHPCFDIWMKNAICDNCISMRAFIENDTVFKIESMGDKIYMVTAVPVNVMARKLIVELLKETTQNLVFGDAQHGQDVRIFTMIEHMNRVAVKDALTEVFNRRYINERLPVDLLNAYAKDEPLSIIFADLDFFKKVNDTYGHMAGDAVLKEFAGLLDQHISKDKDWVARYGGEEFMLCLTNTHKSAAVEVAERIRKSMENKVFTVGSNSISITCSFGVHTIDENSRDATADEVIELVDKKLYEAKRLGRNRVVY
ncbi:response regulator PleD [Oxobacter pfennigii]|uniref:Response regulator PleD n=1 Tax=Oxobacter pfennigii TaxID=36849 RepID=A0A0P8Y9Y0_9CLOT|nr:GGDEF domain-containing protein [Oxobacter pfennigii]KPU43737.1 response regulator PleD [Oxobacter pfennigii]